MPLAGLSIGKRSALLLDKENMTKYSISPMSSLYELYLRHPRISTDSRRIEPDSVCSIRISNRRKNRRSN